tara:strand:- start:10567 stop:10992 length:426 start_codon:yes stop_codon:yes gene_type:complete
MRLSHELELEEADLMLQAAHKAAVDNNWAVSVAVVDAGGHLIAFRRLSGATRSSVQIAIDKARSAALTGRPTSFFEDMVCSGKSGALALAGIVPMTGGLPIFYAQTLVGGIAASGVASAFDVQIAGAGLDALQVAPRRTTP